MKPPRTRPGAIDGAPAATRRSRVRIVLDAAATAKEHAIYSAGQPTTWPSTPPCWGRSSAHDALGLEELAVRSDSQLLVEQMNGGYRVKAHHLKPLWLRAHTLAAALRRFSIQHVPRESNHAADALANRANRHRSSTLPRPEGV